ncbi:zf-HC2 domain-containing protein [Lutibaculum baratangense]|uniref:Putative zinc-finger domain-containing protein n=1 Tax=Lutibaculum baratangense AMV1 TaxID=631454 RepID=V4RGZ6_9HYPH|nr:zf-HC2 domain-containing protein [Lutibaculum baratangense]ESR24644.1 hypothetical protein N177_2324 [Lutibaculum baratangense AMV1]
MLNCREITENADRYLDKEMGFLERLQMRLHLMMCRHCTRYVEQLKATIAMLRDLRLEQPAEESRERLVEVLRGDGGRPPLRY